jgi:hypothetical protein
MFQPSKSIDTACPRVAEVPHSDKWRMGEEQCTGQAQEQGTHSNEWEEGVPASPSTCATHATRQTRHTRHTRHARQVYLLVYPIPDRLLLAGHPDIRPAPLCSSPAYHIVMCRPSYHKSTSPPDPDPNPNPNPTPSRLPPPRSLCRQSQARCPHRRAPDEGFWTFITPRHVAHALGPGPG